MHQTKASILYGACRIEVAAVSDAVVEGEYDVRCVWPHQSWEGV